MVIACEDAGSRSATPSQSLVGTWRALEYVDVTKSDSARRFPFGRPPRGYLVYDATGHVFMQVLRGLAATPEVRGRWAAADSATLLRLLTDGAAYFGTFQEDYQAGTVIHRIEGEIPPHLGTSEVATPVHVAGDTLQLGRDSLPHWVFVRVRERR